MAFSLFKKLFARDEGRGTLRPLYRHAVEVARDPDWYLKGGVPDTLDGRFDMLAAIIALLMIRFEGAGEDGKVPGVLLTELFIDDMDGQLREDGIGDVVVGKHIGRMMSMLGGRIAAYREGLEGGTLSAALTRNLYRGDAPGDDYLSYAADRLRALHARIEASPIAELIAAEGVLA
jgi:cytochrome b pre-mRNA-processing protein 3